MTFTIGSNFGHLTSYIEKSGLLVFLGKRESAKEAKAGNNYMVS